MFLEQSAKPQPPPPGRAESALIRQLLAESARTERLLAPDLEYMRRAVRELQPELEYMRRMVRELKPVLAAVLALQRSPELQLALQTFKDPGLFDDMRAALRAWERETQPGTFLGDVLIATGNDPAQAADAIERRVSDFTWGQIFHPNRRALLTEPLRNYAAEAEVTQREAQHRLTVTALWCVLRDPAFWTGKPERRLYSTIRRRVRTEIERALLGGYTLDQRQEIATDPDDLPEDPHGLDTQIAELFADLETRAEQLARQQLLAAILATLTPRELEALEGTETDGASRTARSRARRKVREALAMM